MVDPSNHPPHSFAEDLVDEKKRAEAHVELRKKKAASTIAANALINAIRTANLQHIEVDYDRAVAEITEIESGEKRIFDSAESIIREVGAVIQAFHAAAEPFHKIKEFVERINERKLNEEEVAAVLHKFYSELGSIESMRNEIERLSAKLNQLLQVDVVFRAELSDHLKDMLTMVEQAHNNLVHIPEFAKAEETHG
jgi:hypothetical protein